MPLLRGRIGGLSNVRTNNNRHPDRRPSGADVRRPTGVVLVEWEEVAMEPQAIFWVGLGGVFTVGLSIVGLLIIVILAYELTK